MSQELKNYARIIFQPNIVDEQEVSVSGFIRFPNGIGLSIFFQSTYPSLDHYYGSLTMKPEERSHDIKIFPYRWGEAKGLAPRILEEKTTQLLKQWSQEAGIICPNYWLSACNVKAEDIDRLLSVMEKTPPQDPRIDERAIYALFRAERWRYKKRSVIEYRAA